MIDVTPISQRDSRWADMPIGTGTHGDKNIGNWGCLLAAYYMQAVYWGLFDGSLIEYNDYMTAKGAFTGPYIKPGAQKIAFPDGVEYDGYIQRSNASMVQIARSRLSDNIPVPARVDFKPETARWEQHWVLLLGYYAVDDDFIMADPWTGKIRPVSDVYDISGTDVLEILLYRPSKPTDGAGGDLEALRAELNKKTQEINDLHQKIAMVREILNV